MKGLLLNPPNIFYWLQISRPVPIDPQMIFSGWDSRKLGVVYQIMKDWPLLSNGTMRDFLNQSFAHLAGPISFFAKIANKEEALSEEKLVLPLPPPFVFLRTAFRRYLALNFAFIILCFKYFPPMLPSFSERCQITATTAGGSRDIHVSENATQNQIGTHTN